MGALKKLFGRGEPTKKAVCIFCGSEIDHFGFTATDLIAITSARSDNKSNSELFKIYTKVGGKCSNCNSICCSKCYHNNNQTCPKCNEKISYDAETSPVHNSSHQTDSTTSKNIEKVQPSNQHPNPHSKNTTVFVFILWPNSGYHALGQNQTTMNEIQKEKMAKSILERVGLKSADVKVFAHAEWDAPIIKTINQSDVAQNYAAIQQGMKKVLKNYGVPDTELDLLTKEVDGAPNPDWGFLTFWIIYKGSGSGFLKRNKIIDKKDLPNDSPKIGEIAGEYRPLSEIPKEHWKGLNVVVYGVPDYNRSGVCVGHTVKWDIELVQVLFDGEPKPKEYSPKFVKTTGIQTKIKNPDTFKTNLMFSQGETKMSSEGTISQYLQQIGAATTPFNNIPGANGVRSITATYMGLQAEIQILNEQILMLQFVIGYAPPMNAEPLLRQLMILNSMMVGVYFCVFQANNCIVLRSSRMLEGLDFVEFKQALDTICNAYMQNGVQMARIFQISPQPLQ
ncbi:MAG: hypothetical protein KC445_10275 [Anaerolineales bacterium]|nr:hypothetical protein [Anaerolineales bacterium]